MFPPERLDDDELPRPTWPGLPPVGLWIDDSILERLRPTLRDWLHDRLPWFWPRNWWMYQHDDRHSGYAFGWSAITSTSVSHLIQLPAVSLDGPVITKPSIVDGNVYVGSGRYAGVSGGTLYKIDLGPRLRSWVKRGGCAAVAVLAVGLILLLFTPTASADTGATGGQPAATDTTTTADPQGQGSGTPDGTQPAGSTSSQVVGGTGSSSAPDQSSGSGTAAPASGQGSNTGTATPAAASGAPAASPSQTVSAAPVPSTPSAATQSAGSNGSADQSGAQNNSTTIRTGQGGNDGPVSQGNSTAATAASTAAGGTTPAGAGSTSNATATATQTAPNNTDVVVRVGSPGNVGGANQSNGVQAAAGATADPSSGGAGGAGVANAQATQTSPSNVSVVVRVASPGDNGPVAQQNSTGATAGAKPPTPVTGDVTAGPAGATDQTVPTTGSAAGTNVSATGQLIDQRQGGDPPNAQVSPTLAAGAGKPSSVGTATATQTGASNVNVSVRVGSPGRDGSVTQTNDATASGTSPQLSVVHTDGGTNTNVSIVIPGLASGPPGADWRWNWSWDGTWNPPANPSAGNVAPTSAAAWNWNWRNTPGASAPPAASATAPGSTPTGVFTWTWTWTQANGQTTTWTWHRACDCNWRWNWTWDWSKGTPASTTPARPSSEAPQAAQPVQTYDTGAVSQQNSVAANAVAGVTLATSQTVDQQPGINAGQSQTLASDQFAEADAFARALNTYNRNLGWGVATGTVAQSNTLEADAVALDQFNSLQVTIQRQTGSPTTNQTMSAKQWTGNDQVAVARAHSVQTDVGNTNVAWAPHANSAAVGAVEQRNSGVSTAISWNTAGALQWIQQFQYAGSASQQNEQAVNVLWNLQGAISIALVAQAGLLNVNDLLVPADGRATNPTVSQRNIATSTTTSLNVDVTEQRISQTQYGQSNNELSVASNVSVTIQIDVESMLASQRNLVNRAAWLGIEPPAPPSSGGAGGTTSIRGESSSASVVVSASVAVDVPGVAVGFTGKASSKRKPTVHAPLLPQVPPCVPGCLPLPGTQAAGGVSYPAAASARPETNSSSASRPAKVNRPRTGPEQSPAGPSPPDGLLDLGPPGSAPLSGGGLLGLLVGLYRFAAPAQLGPHSPAPALGPPVTATDPFERPG